MRSKTCLLASMALALLANGSVPALAQEAAFPVGQQKLRLQRRAIPNRYIVKFRDGITKREIAQIAKDLGARNRPILRLYKQALNGFAIRLSAQQAQELAQDDRVEFVEEDAQMSLRQVDLVPCSTTASDGHIPSCASQTEPAWDLDRLNQSTTTLDSSYTQVGTGKNVNVYVVDTGILTTHTDFQGRATSVYDAINDGNGGTDCNGHGTFAAGLIGGSRHGVAKEANLKSVRVLDCNGNGTASDIIAAIDWITANAPRPSVVNMSLGGVANASLDTAVQNAISAGYIYVVAAGNDDVDVSEVSPARVPSAFTVGSRDNQDNQADFSNYGSLVDFYVPGVDVYSDFNNSNTGQAIGSGTSFSAPLVAGLFAVQLEWNPDLTVATQAVTNSLNANGLGATFPNSGSSGSSGSTGVGATNIGKIKAFNIGKIKAFNIGKIKAFNIGKIKAFGMPIVITEP
jgi:Subtilase family/Peptidase inhibitor I9